MAILDLTEYKARRELDEASAARDAALTAALLSAEGAVLDYTGRDFTTPEGAETREYVYDGSIILETDDFTDLTSVVANGAALPTTSYIVGPREGQTYYWIDFSPSAQQSGYSAGQMGFTRNLDTYFERHRNCGRSFVNVAVTATFGWPGDAPAAVQQAIVFLVDEFGKSEGSVGDIQAESIADLSYVYQRDSEGNAVLPPRVAQLLDPYRRVAL
jgi:hypothetical protein